jgi:hypothetical protein
VYPASIATASGKLTYNLNTSSLKVTVPRSAFRLRVVVISPCFLFLALQKTWPAAALAVVCNVLVEAGARVIVCGTALLGLESLLASNLDLKSAPSPSPGRAVGELEVPVGDDPDALPESPALAALGHYLRAWTPSHASHFLRSFLQVYPKTEAGPGSGGAGGASSSAGSLCLSDLDISDFPGLFPCA